MTSFFKSGVVTHESTLQFSNPFCSNLDVFTAEALRTQDPSGQVGNGVRRLGVVSRDPQPATSSFFGQCKYPSPM